MLEQATLLAEQPAPVLEHAAHSRELSAAEAALLAVADPGLECRISLIGPHTLELLCALLRRGSADVEATRVSDRPPACSADVAIIPHVASPDCLQRAIAHARRVLAPLGTVAIHLAECPADPIAHQAGRLLLLHGFTSVRFYDHAGETLIRAELPLHGRLACA